MDFRRLFDLFAYQNNRFPQEVALASREDLLWRTYSTEECLTEIDRVSAGGLDLGLSRGDRIAIMTPQGSPRWNFLDQGMLQIGVVVVPIHATVTDQELEFILKDAEVKYCVVGDREQYDRVAGVRSKVLSLKKVFTLQAHPDIPGWADLVSRPMEKHLEALQGLRAAIHEEDLATILYTSGSTGQPKGVMLSHKNIVSNIKSVISLIPVNCDKRVLSFLPMSHIFERMVVYTYIAVGASVYYARSSDTILEDIREVQPHYFTAVPRMIERMQNNILERAASKGVIQRRLLNWAIRLGKKFPEAQRMSLGYWLQHRLADVLIYHRWRRLLGGKVEGVVVGAAALQPELGRLFSAAGIDIREGYGLTETAPVVTFNRFEPGGVRFGTVGIPIPGVEVKVDAPAGKEEGEILVKGPNVMLGYHRGESERRQSFTPEGWFRTGDIGKLVHKRFLMITGRKKDIFKTSSGKYIPPEPLENRLKDSDYIEQCLVVGEQRSAPAVLIIPNFPLLKQWCFDHEVHWTAPQFMVLNPKVIQLFEKEIEQRNESLPAHQHIRHFALLHQPWTAENGDLTPTLKPRRSVLQKRHQKIIEQLYQQK